MFRSHVLRRAVRIYDRDPVIHAGPCLDLDLLCPGIFPVNGNPLRKPGQDDIVGLVLRIL